MIDLLWLSHLFKLVLEGEKGKIEHKNIHHCKLTFLRVETHANFLAVVVVKWYVIYDSKTSIWERNSTYRRLSNG